MAEQLVGGGPSVHLHLETAIEKVLKVGTQLIPALDIRPTVGGDQVEGAEWSLV